MTTQTNLSAVWKQPGGIELEARQTSLPRQGEIKIHVEASGLCGTDLHIAAGETPNATPGVVIGHEFAGTIMEVGPGVAGFLPGERVVIDPNIPCLTCHYCHTARPHLCEKPQALGVSIDGGMAEFAVVPAAQAYHVPADLPPEAAALTEPLACALHAVDQAHLRSGETALVLGAGPIGILCTSLLIAEGASKVLVSEPRPDRRAHIRAFGAEPVDPDALPSQQADVVLECVGRGETMRASIDAVRTGGTVVWVGVAAPDLEIGVRPYDVYRRELTIRSTYTNPFTMERAIALLTSRRINWEAIVTHRFALNRFSDAWTVHRQGNGLKVCVQP